MSLDLSTLGHASALALSVGAVALIYALVIDPASVLRRALVREAERLESELSFQRLALRGTALLAGQMIAALLAALTAWVTGVWPLSLLAGSAVFAPRLWIERRRAARVIAIEGQLSAWLVSVAGALRAGNPIGEALAASVEVTPVPLAEEVKLALDEHRLGVPLDEALGLLSKRIGSRTVASAVFVLALARQTGGEVPLTLERAAASLRELARLEGVVRTKTAEGKTQALVISLIPAPLVGAIELSSPGYFEPLTATTAGHVVMTVVAISWVSAIILARRIVAVEV